ncbi:hypothetical protein TCAL_15845 [Tigriopus californicus]|uniref:Uncharacterized protein n=1 Tax=Tigriopus californicus TaxID=6832 RepID=A0A553NQL4_TIGCA|nr:hypothetical protein TCAL_15845 [Tigriopus californicus]
MAMRITRLDRPSPKIISEHGQEHLRDLQDSNTIGGADGPCFGRDSSQVVREAQCRLRSSKNGMPDFLDKLLWVNSWRRPCIKKPDFYHEHPQSDVALGQYALHLSPTNRSVSRLLRV